MMLTELERELLVASEHYPIEAYLTWVEIMRTPARSERLAACKRLNAIRRGYQLMVLPWPRWEDSF